MSETPDSSRFARGLPGNQGETKGGTREDPAKKGDASEEQWEHRDWVMFVRFNPKPPFGGKTTGSGMRNA